MGTTGPFSPAAHNHHRTAAFTFADSERWSCTASLGDDISSTDETAPPLAYARKPLTRTTLTTGVFAVLWGFMVTLGEVPTLLAETLPGIDYGAEKERATTTRVLLNLVALPLIAWAATFFLTKATPTRKQWRTSFSHVCQKIRLVGQLLGARKYAPGQLLSMTGATLVLLILILAADQLLPLLTPPESWIPPTPDPRTTAQQEATPVTAFVHGLLHAPLTEEIQYRGPLLLVQWVLLDPVKRKKITGRTGTILLVTGATASAIWFGSAHLGWNVLNGLTAGTFGASAAAITLRYRTLLPALLAHALHNAIITLR